MSFLSTLTDVALIFENGPTLNAYINTTLGNITFSSDDADTLVKLSGVRNPTSEQDASTKNYTNSFVIQTPAFTTSAAGTTSLTNVSKSLQILTGTTTQTYTLPNATTLDIGTTFTFENQSTGLLTVNDFAASPITTVSSTYCKRVVCTNTGSSAGTWVILEEQVSAGVLSVSGTANRITSTGGVNPVIDIAATYVGQSSITTLGTITTGTWNGSVLGPTYGGTGINNGSSTITLAGNLTTAGSLTTSGAFPLILTTTGSTNVTLPTSGTLLSNVPAALTRVDDTNVTLTLGGTPATALLQATSITAGWNGQLSLVRGGTNANLTASNGGIFYSTASAGAILSGTATANQVLLSGSSTAPSWSTATYPPTTTTNQLLYSSANNTITGLATANSASLLTNGSGVPAWVVVTGTGAPVLANTPTLITPIIGAATGTSLSVSGSLRSGTSLVLEDPGAGTNTTTIQAATLASSYTLTLPVDVGTNTQLLTTNGGNPATLSWVNKPNLITTFLTTGTTYTSPAGITTATVFRITVIGGGGGGGGTNGGTSRGAGGGGGGCGVAFVSGLSPSTGYTIAIGAAGTAGAGTPTAGGAGGNTSITINATTYTANGGGGGVASSGSGGAGGTTTNCTISIPGQDGGSTNTLFDLSGLGGISQYGRGGAGIRANGNGSAGTGYGGGGSGAYGTGNRSGGAGAAGAIIIEYVL
jgi:hypothetical protein